MSETLLNDKLQYLESISLSYKHEDAVFMVFSEESGIESIELTVGNLRLIFPYVVFTKTNPCLSTSDYKYQVYLNPDTLAADRVFHSGEDMRVSRMGCADMSRLMPQENADKFAVLTFKLDKNAYEVLGSFDTVQDMNAYISNSCTGILVSVYVPK
jgi:hypothetical protein